MLNQTLLFLAQAETAPPNALAQIIPFIFIGIIFYFLLIRPQQKQRKQHAELISKLATGDKVITTSGIHGIITNVKPSSFIIKIDDNVKIEIDKGHVANKKAETAE